MAAEVGGSNWDKVGLALSYFGDAANAAKGRQSNFAGDSLRNLQRLQQQLLLNQEIATKQGKAAAQAQVAGGFDPKTNITWDTGRQAPNGLTETIGAAPAAGGVPPLPEAGMANWQPEAAPAVGLAPAAPEAVTPGLANQVAPSTFGVMNPAEFKDSQNDFQNSRLKSLIAANPEAYTQAVMQQEFAGPTRTILPEGAVEVVRDRKGNEISRTQGNPKSENTPESLRLINALNNMSPDDPRRPALQAIVDRAQRVEAESGLGKLAADLKAGRIDQATYDAAVRKDTYIPPEAASAIAKLGVDLKAGRITQQQYDDAVAKETHITQPNPIAVADPSSPTGQRYVQPSAATGQPAGGTRFNGEQNLAAGFANRMDLAEADLKDVMDFKKNPGFAGFDPAAVIATAVANQSRMAASEPRKLYRQAAENWVTANLRKESGAAIGTDEMANEVRKYFPEAGDPQSVINQKADARKAAMHSMKFASGGAYDALKKQGTPEIKGSLTPTSNGAPALIQNGRRYDPVTHLDIGPAQ